MKKSNKLIILGVVLLVVIILVRSSIFIVTEGRQAIITQFGRPIGKAYTKAGPYFKTPFLHEVRYVDNGFCLGTDIPIKSLLRIKNISRLTLPLAGEWWMPLNLFKPFAMRPGPRPGSMPFLTRPLGMLFPIKT